MMLLYIGESKICTHMILKKLKSFNTINIVLLLMVQTPDAIANVNELQEKFNILRFFDKL